MNINTNCLKTIANYVWHPVKTYQAHKAEVVRAVKDLHQIRDLTRANRELSEAKGEALRRVVNLEKHVHYADGMMQIDNRQDMHQVQIEQDRRDTYIRQTRCESESNEEESKSDIGSMEPREGERLDFIEHYISIFQGHIDDREAAGADRVEILREAQAVKAKLEEDAPGALSHFKDLLSNVEVYDERHGISKSIGCHME